MYQVAVGEGAGKHHPPTSLSYVFRRADEVLLELIAQSVITLFCNLFSGPLVEIGTAAEANNTSNDIVDLLRAQKDSGV